MKIIAGCILIDDQDRILLVQERQKRVEGLWNIPAGYAEEGETPFQAAIRETYEEVGLRPSPDSRAIHMYINPEKGKRYYAFIARTFSGELVPQAAELLDAKWLTFSEIERLQEQNLIREPWIYEALLKARA